MNTVLCFVFVITLANLVELKNGWRKDNLNHWSKRPYHRPVPDKEDGSVTKPDVGRNEPADDDWYEIFKRLADKVIAQDNDALGKCKKYTRAEPTEIYGTHNYKFIFPLNYFDPEYITITIKHRVMFIKGVTPDIDPRFQNDDNSSFVEIKIFPPILDAKRARWFARNGKLEIEIPYKFTLNREHKKTCEIDFGVDEKEIVVPKGEEEIGIDNNVMNQIFGNKSDSIPENILNKIFGKTTNAMRDRMSDDGDDEEPVSRAIIFELDENRDIMTTVLEDQQKIDVSKDIVMDTFFGNNTKITDDGDNEATATTTTTTTTSTTADVTTTTTKTTVDDTTTTTTKTTVDDATTTAKTTADDSDRVVFIE